MIRIYAAENYEEMSERAARIIAAQVILKPECVLGLATGSSPIGTYKGLVDRYKAGKISFAGVTTVNLDEYKGLSGAHDQSYRYFMQHNLFDHIDVRPECTHVPNGLAEDAEAECARYDAFVRSLGCADLQLLGVGRNGHIGFNEPDDHFTCGCHVVNLTESTIQANRRFFDSEDDVPRQAISLGIGSIMNARRILLLATGADKAEAIRNAVYGDINPRTQASILRTHSNVIFLLDKAAAGLL